MRPYGPQVRAVAAGCTSRPAPGRDTVDVNPKSPSYGKVVHTLSVGGRGEAHHMGFTDDRKHLWAGGLDDSRIHIFDVGTDPAKPKLVKTLGDLPRKTGLVGPHTFCALPGRMLVQALSNSKDHGGATGIAVYNNKGEFIAEYEMPSGDVGGVKSDGKGGWQAKDVATIGDPAKIPLPVDISISADGKGLWVNTFMDGTTHCIDLSDPEAPKETYSRKTGKQVNMISQSWDGKRVCITSSLLANWDKKGEDNEQFLALFHWDGKELKEQWRIDFNQEKLGRAHHMKFSAKPKQT